MINSNKTAREFIKNICEKYDVKSELILVGYGNTYDDSKKRYIYQTGDSLIDNTVVRYVVKYFKKEDFFLVWEINKSKRRIDFSASYEQVQGALDRKRTFTKSIEYSGWDEESVLVLSKSEMGSFIASLKHPDNMK